MSQDIVSDALSEIMNAKKARKNFVILKKHSKLLRNILEIAKKLGYLDYKDEKNNLKIEIKNINEINTIKDVEKLTNEDIFKMIGINVSPSRIKCVLLSLSAIKKGVKLNDIKN